MDNYFSFVKNFIRKVFVQIILLVSVIHFEKKITYLIKIAIIVVKPRGTVRCLIMKDLKVVNYHSE